MNSFNKAFTLIELLVVISIISVLSSILLVALKDSRALAIDARAAEMMHGLKIALELHYQDHGDWPGSSAGTTILNNGTVAWNSFVNSITPYMPGFKIEVPLVVDAGNNVLQGFVYRKGRDDQPPKQAFVFNGKTGAPIGCIKVYKGYYLSYAVGNGRQSSFTTGDNGFDPDAIDYAYGNVVLDTTLNLASCPPVL
jgi:prepilin-type N-terminal cleavage/methylation domain-containing protein